MGSASSSRNEIIEKIIGYAKKNLTEQELKIVPTFIRQYYFNFPLEDLVERSIPDLFGMAYSHWKLIQERRPGQYKIHVFNPTVKQNHWHSKHTIVEIIHDDVPFLVDSLRMAINRLGYTIHLVIHLGGMKTQRNKKGVITKIYPLDSPIKDVNVEAAIHLEIDHVSDSTTLKYIQDNLKNTLRDVEVVVADWKKMQERVHETLTLLGNLSFPLDPEDVEESKAFLRWLVDGHFTFLGARDYELTTIDGRKVLKIVKGSGLGVLRDESKSKQIRFLDDLPSAARKQALSKQVLIISQTNTKATVHRPTLTIYIGVKLFNEAGEVVGERRFIGLYTSDAYNSNPEDIPYLRRKVNTILKKSGIFHYGHVAKALLNIIETLPRDDLFQGTVDELCEIAMGISQLQERKQIRLFLRKDAYNRYVSCLVYLPREKFSTDLINKMQTILVQAFDGHEVSFSTYFPESVLARIHYVIYTDPKRRISYDTKSIENQLSKIGRLWTDDLSDLLLEQFGEEKGNELIGYYKNAFPPGYRDAYSPQSAVFDIQKTEKLNQDHPLEMSFYQRTKAEKNHLRFKLYRLNQSIPLSDVIPILENMGLKVIGEQPHEVISHNGGIIWINDFNLLYQSNVPLDLEEIRDLFQEAFEKIWYNKADNDGFNRLVLTAKLSWREIFMLRTYAKYLRQIGFTFSQQYIEQAFSNNPSVASLLVKFFKLRFDPTLKKPREKTESIEKQFETELDNVANLDEDRIFRRYLEVIKATLRTNYFQHDDNKNYKSYLSLKFNPKLISELPLPLPKRETFVYSTLFEGVHLRGGKVARGGIRWSDRREDFRTEVLGLMKAQQVKNAVIVPAGAKGGFVAKLPPDANRETIMREGINCYKDFIRGLLDVVDNLVKTKIVTPPRTIRYDDDDPYLVVAADKGTATFSDIANTISKEYHFWLGDAFASGGSTGYDHKKIGITARGTWESVKRHFKELGIDPLKDNFTVIGIGDMSGDVFGNGMLLSNHIKLVAAFNHMHIFLDPNPDPKTSFFERLRLFNLQRSTWEDYNPELISEGGGVYRRNVKSIKLSPEVKALLNINKETLVPNELVRAILKAPVDLLWNGGIGTFVKASEESNNDVGDRTNDAVRINGNELHCLSVAEGGNLGFTQLGRIEYEFSGGKINTDFIDNSGGVDCSDHEVNIKILLNAIVNEGKMSEKQRNRLLAEMTDEVASLVLYNNYRQTRSISFAARRSLEYLDLYRQFMDAYESAGKINRALEFLPDNKVLHERKQAARGLTRPEIAVLLAYSKIILKNDILKSKLPEEPLLSEYIEMAFPHILQRRFEKQMDNHYLKREIIATQLSNEIVTDMGITFVYQMRDENSVTSSTVARAYIAVRKIFDLQSIWKDIELLNNSISVEIQIEMISNVNRLARRATRWILKNCRPKFNIEETIQYFKAHISHLIKALPKILSPKEKEIFNEKVSELIIYAIPFDIANKIALTQSLCSALNIIEIAVTNKTDLIQTAKMYFNLMERLELFWFREEINHFPVDNHWAVLARAAFKSDLETLQRALTSSALKLTDSTKRVETRIDEWFKNYKREIARWSSILGDLRTSPTNDFSMLSVAMRELAELAKISDPMNQQEENKDA